jgi:hypothetical protein
MGGSHGGSSQQNDWALSIKLSRQYRLFVLSLAGDVLGNFKPDPDPGFGIRNVIWHPSGMFLAVSGWDNKVSMDVDYTSMFSSTWQIHILEQLTWSSVATLELGTKIPTSVVTALFHFVNTPLLMH